LRRECVGREVRPDVLAHDPVDGDVLADGLHDVGGDAAQLLVTKDMDSAVVPIQGFVEGEIVVGLSQR
jgi:hypothetical protein